ncbi:DNA repair protein RecO [Planctomicrobium sp. SH664]|uniref:DNA repair protein RecO n=1 Tax=Planctomicrobium sp. SH664 TaxID=3448125 RepID=UPI003F5C81ED
MSTEKSRAIVIRQADFSESSRVVTLFSRDFGKISCLAKGAKRLKSSFEVSLDLLAECDIVFLKKSTGGLDLLTEARLVRRFQPLNKSLSHLYSGYYVAELLSSLTEEHDPHPELYAAAVEALNRLSIDESAFVAVSRFELAVLREIGQLPDFDTCTICQNLIEPDAAARFWVSQSGLICSSCGRSDYQTSEFHSGSLVILRKLLESEDEVTGRIVVSVQQRKEIRRLLTAAISHVCGRRPKTLPLIDFEIRDSQNRR